MENIKNNELLALPVETEMGMTPDLYWFYEGLNSRTIIINNEIDSSIIEQVALPLKKMEKENPQEKITIYLNTTGGSVWDGMVICNLIDNISCPVEIIVLGYALSMGSYILMSGFNNPNVTKKCYEFSFALIHAGSVSLAGDAKKVKQTQKFNDKIDEKIKKYLLSHSKIDEETYNLHEDEEWYLTSEEMLMYGLVDEIIK